MNSFIYTVVEIVEQAGFYSIWVTVSSSDPAIYASGTVGLQVSNEIAALNTVGGQLVLA